MAGKLRVAVLMGGKSPEHEISLISGRQVVSNLNPQKYDVIPIVISRDGRSLRLNNKKYSLSQLSIVNCQLFFIAMHGPYGEDGTVQGFLELVGVLYTGSGVLASALSMDKISSRKLFTQAGLNVPKYQVVEKGKRTRKVRFGWPVFVKPYNQGSSVGASIVKSSRELNKALKHAWRYSRLALIEEYLKGVEITCPILGNKNPRTLPLVEIVPKKPFFDFEAKYSERLCDEIVPARIGKVLTRDAQDAAVVAYQTLGCRGFARVDMIIKDSKVYVLEVNTIPGLTPVSLFPKSAQATGISYQKLLDQIISLGLQKENP